MRIVADRNILAVEEACAGLGEVRLVTGREVGPSDVADADALLVRSVTRVDDALLEGSRVRFVGTATIGVDHLDASALARRGITVASAPGSNAPSVAEWLVSTLLELAVRTGERLAGKTLGIVGVGNVGTAVAERAGALDLELLLNDPPKARATGDPAYRPLDELLERADILTLHTPLTRDGLDPTFHLFDAAVLARARRGAWLVSSGRGAVVDSPALLAALDSGRLGAAALDVWEEEPRFDAALLDRVTLVSPHVAGYGLDGKLAGTRMVVAALRSFAGVEPAEPSVPDGPHPHPRVELELDGRDDEELLRAVVGRVCPVVPPDRALRDALALTPDERAHRFDELRRGYPVRRAFHHTEVVLAGSPRPSLERALTGLGFRLAADARFR